MASLVVRLVSPDEPDDLIHRFRNYGEDVFRFLRINGWGELDVDELDRATREFRVGAVKGATLRRLKAWLGEEAARHNLAIAVEES